MASHTLPQWLEEFGPNFNIDHIIGLLDALRKIHSVTYIPASFHSLQTSGEYSNFDTSHPLFHGDISPYNIICEKIEENGRIIPRLILTDYHSIGDINKLVWTTGWASPECIKFMNKTAYQNLDTPQFLAKYGANKDAWAMGLMLGSLLRGRFLQIHNRPLPCFSFITDKIKFASTKEVDESGLADLTQNEIDTKLNAMIQDESSQTIKCIWMCVKGFLKVDPDNRPTVANCFLGQK